MKRGCGSITAFTEVIRVGIISCTGKIQWSSVISPSDRKTPCSIYELLHWMFYQILSSMWYCNVRNTKCMQLIPGVESYCRVIKNSEVAQIYSRFVICKSSVPRWGYLKQHSRDGCYGRSCILQYCPRWGGLTVPSLTSNPDLIQLYSQLAKCCWVKLTFQWWTLLPQGILYPWILKSTASVKYLCSSWNCCKYTIGCIGDCHFKGLSKEICWNTFPTLTSLIWPHFEQDSLPLLRVHSVGCVY